MFQKPSPEVSLSQGSKVHDDVETVVGPSVHVEGDFSSEGNILVKGMVSGNVKTSKLLTVEPGAKILANVKAGNALISGSIKGNVKITEKVELTETARIMGDLSCKILEVAPGALIHGKVMMKGINIEGPKTEKKRGLGRTRVREEKKPETQDEE